MVGKYKFVRVILRGGRGGGAGSGHIKGWKVVSSPAPPTGFTFNVDQLHGQPQESVSVLPAQWRVLLGQGRLQALVTAGEDQPVGLERSVLLQQRVVQRACGHLMMVMECVWV